MQHKPARLTYADVARLLRMMADAVEIGDSYEGFIEYLIPEDINERGDPTVEVRARYRVGNLDGQGGMTIVGELA